MLFTANTLPVHQTNFRVSREGIKECAEGIRESREGERHLRYESFDHLRVRVLMISIHVELIISESSPTKRATNQAEMIDRDLLEWYSRGASESW